MILPAFGHESLASARTLRLLAMRLSAQGYPVLRLDPHGTGDAPGDESELDLLANRTQSINEAMRWLREVAGVKRVSIVGLRLGATLAMMQGAALEAHRLALVSPVLTGRGYLRELRQMQSLYEHRLGADGETPANEFNGFKLSDASIRALTGLDIRRAEAAPAESIALLAPMGTPALGALVASWRSAGRNVDAFDYAETDQILADPTTTGPEPSLVDLLAEWFGPARDDGGAYWRPSGPARVCASDWTEQGLRFGPGEGLFGVLCRPARPRPGAPALIIPNTGGNGHIGWGRQTVELARDLAAHGVATLRMDIAGVGEADDPARSRPRIVYVSEAAADVAAAVSFMEAEGYQKPALLGVCSGAFLVFHALRLDAAVSGAVMINLQKFFWREGDPIVLYNSVGSYAARLLDIATLKRALRGEADVRGVARFVAQRVAAMARARLATWVGGLSGAAKDQRDLSPAAILSRVCDRGAYVTMANTINDGGVDEIRSHLGAKGRSLRGKPNFRVATINVADHNFSSSRSRRKLLPVVLDFVNGIAAK